MFEVFRIWRSPNIQNLKHIYFNTAFGKEQFKMTVTVNISREHACVCDQDNTNWKTKRMWNFQIDCLVRNVCLISPWNSSWQLLHHITATTQKRLLRGKYLGLWKTHGTKRAILPAIATPHEHTHFIRSGWAPEKSSLAHFKIAMEMLNTTRQIPTTKWETNSPPVGMRRMENSMSGHLSTTSSSTMRNMQLSVTIMV